jgi:hypothetical protein
MPPRPGPTRGIAPSPGPRPTCRRPPADGPRPRTRRSARPGCVEPCSDPRRRDRRPRPFDGARASGPAPNGGRDEHRSRAGAGSAPPPSPGSPLGGSRWPRARSIRDRGARWDSSNARTIPRSRVVPSAPRPRDRVPAIPRRSRPRDTPRPSGRTRTSRTRRAPPCGPDRLRRRTPRAVRSSPCRTPQVARSPRPRSPSARPRSAVPRVGSRSTVRGSERPGPRGSKQITRASDARAVRNGPNDGIVQTSSMFE